MSTVHKLKIWPEFFANVIAGRKNFEFRLNDRNFQEGDTLVLQEFSPANMSYTGREIERRVGYILHGGSFGLPHGTCIMGLETAQGAEDNALKYAQIYWMQAIDERDAARAELVHARREIADLYQAIHDMDNARLEVRRDLEAVIMKTGNAYRPKPLADGGRK